MLSKEMRDNNVGQGIAAYVDYQNQIRTIDFLRALDSILISETEKLSVVGERFANAEAIINVTTNQIGDLVEINRGGLTGLHGFISEFAETGVRNAREVYQGLLKSAVLLNDNGSADILLNGKEVQMKFYADILSEIKAASEYGKMSMMFPKDHFEVIRSIMNGSNNVMFNGDFLSKAKIENIRNAVKFESSIRGETYDKWLEPSLLRYEEVQKGTINQTLNREMDSIRIQTADETSNIHQEADKSRIEAQQEANPSIGEASKAAAIGAIVQGGLSLGIFLYHKKKEGKNVWELNLEDWKECGLEVGEGILKGGISGYSIYGLTNVFNLAAPSAGAITSGIYGLTTTVVKFRTGKVDTDEFIDLLTFNAIDATGAAIGAAIGQTIIPIPVVGALIGSIVATTTISLGKNILNKHELEVLNQYKGQLDLFVDQLDIEYAAILDSMLCKYRKLGDLQLYSFDLSNNINLRFISSMLFHTLSAFESNNLTQNKRS